jgi:hypothetical protein
MIEADATLQFGEDLLRQFLFFDQDMQGCCAFAMVLLSGLIAFLTLYHQPVNLGPLSATIPTPFED